MQDTMVARPAKVFMIIQKNTFHVKQLQQYFLLLVILIFPATNGCAPELSDDPIPYQGFPAFTINLNLPQYQGVSTDGGWTYIDGGVRGIILYRQNTSTYIAYERNCSY